MADVISLIRAIERPPKVKIRSLQMLPRYLAMKWWAKVDAQLWSLPPNVVLGERSDFLRRPDALINVESVYDVCRLAGSKAWASAVDMDFLHAHGTDVVLTTAPCAIRSASKRVKIIQTVHDLFLYDNTQSDSNGRKFRRKVEACVEHADMILAMSEHTRQVLLSHHPCVDSKVRVLYQPIPADRAAVEASARPEIGQAVLERYGLKARSFLLYVGAIEERKNVATLIEAHRRSQVAARLPLVIVGMAEEGYFRRHGLSPSRGGDGLDRLQSAGAADVLLLGRIDEVDKLALLRSATVFAFPTRMEGFGIPVLEAQSMGCPVVASGASTMPEVLGATAQFIANVDSAGSIAEALDRVVSDPDLAERMRSEGLVNSARFSAGKFASNLAALIGECRRG